MSATLLYHMHGIRGYTFLRQQIVPGGIEFFLAVSPKKLVCPHCQSTNVWRKGSKERRFRSLPFGRKHTTIVLDVPRIHCRDCGTLRQVKIFFAEEHRRCTRFFERYVLDLLLSMTCQDVAEHLGLSWDTVRDIEKRRLKRDFSKPPLKGVTHIAIDEIAVKKGHKYLTVVMDLHSGRVIFVGDGRGADEGFANGKHDPDLFHAYLEIAYRFRNNLFHVRCGIHGHTGERRVCNIFVFDHTLEKRHDVL